MNSGPCRCARTLPAHHQDTMRARHASGKERGPTGISELAPEFDITPHHPLLRGRGVHHPRPGRADPHLQPQGQDPPEIDLLRGKRPGSA